LVLWQTGEQRSKLSISFERLLARYGSAPGKAGVLDVRISGIVEEGVLPFVVAVNTAKTHWAVWVDEGAVSGFPSSGGLFLSGGAAAADYGETLFDVFQTLFQAADRDDPSWQQYAS
jgi:hypothetical protein